MSFPAPQRRALFVTGTGTDIGKTYISAALIRAAIARGLPAIGIKPVVSGVPELNDPAFEDSDTAVLLRAQGLSSNVRTVETCSPWRFAAPLSPDMAAAHEGRRIDFDAVVAWSRARIQVAPENSFALVEGVGGVMSPIAAQHTNLDFLTALNARAILVAGTHLGGISHTLTAVETIRARGVDLSAVVVNESRDSPAGLDETVQTLSRFLPGLRIERVARGGIPESLADLLVSS
jgi:dethiobiotin synthetase